MLPLGVVRLGLCVTHNVSDKLKVRGHVGVDARRGLRGRKYSRHLLVIPPLTWLQLLSKSFLLTTPTKVCLSSESTTVSGPPLSPCPNNCYFPQKIGAKLNQISQNWMRSLTSQVAESSPCAHSENCSSNVSPIYSEVQLFASTIKT